MKHQQSSPSEDVKAFLNGVEPHRRTAQLIIGGLALTNVLVGINAAEREAMPRHQVEILRMAGDAACQAVCEELPPSNTPKETTHPTTKQPRIIVPAKKVASSHPMHRAATHPATLPLHLPVHLAGTFKQVATSPDSSHKLAFSRRQPVNPNDISFPQCKLGFPAAAPFGIVGVNKGHPMSTNPCLKAEVSLYQDYQLYLNADYPGKAVAETYQDSPRHCKANDEICFAYNYGRSSGAYAVNLTLEQGIDNPTGLWLDVETGNKWRGSTAVHRADLQGEVDALTRAGGSRPIGFYSTVHMWQKITGGWDNGLPEWIPSGSNTYDHAASYCHNHNFTGGPMMMAQFTQQFDQNVLCKLG